MSNKHSFDTMEKVPVDAFLCKCRECGWTTLAFRLPNGEVFSPIAFDAATVQANSSMNRVTCHRCADMKQEQREEAATLEEAVEVAESQKRSYADPLDALELPFTEEEMSFIIESKMKALGLDKDARPVHSSTYRVTHRIRENGIVYIYLDGMVPGFPMQLYGRIPLQFPASAKVTFRNRTYERAEDIDIGDEIDIPSNAAPTAQQVRYSIGCTVEER